MVTSHLQRLWFHRQAHSRPCFEQPRRVQKNRPLQNGLTLKTAKYDAKNIKTIITGQQDSAARDSNDPITQCDSARCPPVFLYWALTPSCLWRTTSRRPARGRSRSRCSTWCSTWCSSTRCSRCWSRPGNTTPAPSTSRCWG